MDNYENNTYENGYSGNSAENTDSGSNENVNTGYGAGEQSTGYQNNGYTGGGYQNTGYTDNGYPNGGGSGNGDDGKKPKKHPAAKILVPIAIVASIAGITAFSVNRIGKLRDKTASTRVEETLSQASETMAAQNGESAAGENVSQTSLIKSDAAIASTGVNASTTCIDVSDVVENVMPCVVAITDNLEYTTSSSYNPYNFYFGGGSSGSQKEETTASGSGVIIGQNDTELLIVTNNHVVDNEGNYTSYTISSTGLTVQFSDGSTASATIKGTDSDADLAVIAVKLADITDETRSAIKIAVVGDSDSIKVGSGVIAIGNALGYGQSVTTGIVSAKDREVTIDGITRTLLQTDAAINPGNSGGGLFNSNGELIGINSAKTSETSVEGMGFAIPITSAESIIEDLMNQETIAEEDQGYLGITGETVTSTYVSRYGYPEGVSVTRISAGSPAESAGLQIYDIITSVDGKAVTSMDALKKAINKHPAGDTVTLTVSRPDGRSFKEITIDVTLARYTDISGGFQDAASETDAELLPGEKQPVEPNAGNSPDAQDPNGTDEDSTEDSDMDSLFDWFFNNFN